MVTHSWIFTHIKTKIGVCNVVGNSYTCTCASGFTGKLPFAKNLLTGSIIIFLIKGTNCGLINTTNPCAVNPCLNSGICQIVNINSYLCVCLPQYTGNYY